MLYEAANRPGGEWPSFVESMNEDRNRRFWTDFPREGELGVIAVEGERPVGACWVRYLRGSELSEIDDPLVPVLAIGVEEDVRGDGVGSALLAALITYADDHGIARISLTTGLSNIAAVRLYERNGFLEVRRQGDAVQMIRSAD